MSALWRGRAGAAADRSACSWPRTRRPGTASATGHRRSHRPASPPALEPKAIEILKASSSRLAAARTLSFTAVAGYESPSLPGPALLYTARSLVTVQRPDKLRVITPGDGPASEFYYDGKTVMAFTPSENLVAVANAPSTIDATLEAAYKTAAIYFPFTDAIVADPYGDIAHAAGARVLHRAVERGRWSQDRHDRLRQRRRVRADVDRR